MGREPGMNPRPSRSQSWSSVAHTRYRVWVYWFWTVAIRSRQLRRTDLCHGHLREPMWVLALRLKLDEALQLVVELAPEVDARGD